MTEISQNTGSEQPQQRRYQDDEIDLQKLFQSIGDFFSRVWKGIINLIVSFRRATLDHKILFTILTILGGLTGFGSQKITVPHYKSSMLLHSSILRGQLIENLITKLNQICSEEDNTELASVLGISNESARKIIGFEAIPFVSEDEVIQNEILRIQLTDLSTKEDQINSIIDRIELENKSIYEIVVKSYNIEIDSGLQEAILNYFRASPFIRKRLEVNKRDRELKLAKLKQEGQKMDSLKRLIYKNLSALSDRSRDGSNNVILAEDNTTNPLTVFREDMNLYNQELALEKLLVLEPELEVVDGFTKFGIPVKIGNSRAVIYGLLISIGLGYLYLFFQKYRYFSR